MVAKGEARVCKQVDGGEKGEHRKDVEIVYLSEGSVVGGELFLMQSKTINTIIGQHLPHTHQTI